MLTSVLAPSPAEWPAAAAAPGARARGSKVAAIYAGVLDAVVDHRLPPGAKLSEEQLGGIFSVSRTIVRSALQALAHDNIVTLERNRGAFVCAPTIADAQDIFFSRKLVECAVAREVAKRIEPEHLRMLEALLQQESEALRQGRRPAAIRLSGGFHVAVAVLCGEGATTHFLRSLISRSSLVIALYGRGAASACGHAEHVEFLAALGARDGEKAAALMGAHLEHILSDLDLTPPRDQAVDLERILRREI